MIMACVYLANLFTWLIINIGNIYLLRMYQIYVKVT